MHRHGYSGRKFHREKDQRNALIGSLAEALIINESIETTIDKAREVRPFVEKLITKAKKGDLHNRRQVIEKLQTKSTAHKLVDEISPKLSNRNSGYLRIVKTKFRRGDNAQLARISFVDDLSDKKEVVEPKAENNVPKEAKTTKASAKTTSKKKETK